MYLKKLSDLTQYSNMLLITDNDLDGIMSGVFFTLRFPKTKWIYTRKYLLDEMLDNGEIFNYDALILIDCFPKTKQDLENLSEILNLYIIDHHQSFKNSLAIWGNKDKFNIDTNISSTMILYNLLDDKNDRETLLSSLVNSYDMWEEDRYSFEDSKLLNAKLNYLGIESFISNTKSYILSNLEDIIPTIDWHGFQKFVRIENEYVNKRAMQAKIQGNKGITFAERNKSEIANKILNNNKGLIDVALVIDMTNNTVSVRSKNGIALATAQSISHLSGGHLNSAGCRVNFKEAIYDYLD